MKVIEADKKQREKWEVEDAVRTLIEYQKILKDKELKEKAIKELEKKSNEYKEIAKDIK
jgi:cell division FtsZ-interacting protein ZapD